MNDHRFGNPALAAFIADQHEPERKPMRTPERVAQTGEERFKAKMRDRGATNALKPPALTPHQSRKVAELKTAITAEWDERNDLLAFYTGHRHSGTAAEFEAQRQATKRRELAMAYGSGNRQFRLYAEAAEQLKQNGERVHEELIAGHCYQFERTRDDGSTAVLFSVWNGEQWMENSTRIDRARLSTTLSHGFNVPASLMKYRIVRDLDTAPEAPAKRIEKVTLQDGVELIAGHVYEFECKSGKKMPHFSKWDGVQWCHLKIAAEHAAKASRPSIDLNNEDLGKQWRLVANHGPADALLA